MPQPTRNCNKKTQTMQHIPPWRDPCFSWGSGSVMGTHSLPGGPEDLAYEVSSPMTPIPFAASCSICSPSHWQLSSALQFFSGFLLQTPEQANTHLHYFSSGSHSSLPQPTKHVLRKQQQCYSTPDRLRPNTKGDRESANQECVPQFVNRAFLSTSKMPRQLP